MIFKEHRLGSTCASQSLRNLLEYQGQGTYQLDALFVSFCVHELDIWGLGQHLHQFDEEMGTVVACKARERPLADHDFNLVGFVESFEVETPDYNAILIGVEHEAAESPCAREFEVFGWNVSLDFSRDMVVDCEKCKMVQADVGDSMVFLSVGRVLCCHSVDVVGVVFNLEGEIVDVGAKFNWEVQEAGLLAIV